MILLTWQMQNFHLSLLRLLAINICVTVNSEGREVVDEEKKSASVHVETNAPGKGK